MIEREGESDRERERGWGRETGREKEAERGTGEVKRGTGVRYINRT